MAEAQKDWSDWEVEKQPSANYSDEYSLPRSSISEALGQLPARLTEDIVNTGANFIGNVPDYIDKASMEVPALLQKTFSRKPNEPPNQGIKNQLIAGLAKGGYNLFNMPHDIINYLSDRLELIPESINKNIQMSRMPADTETMINKHYGEPKEPGETLARGLGEHSLALTSIGGTAGKIPKLSKKNILSDVIKTGQENERFYGNHYQNLFNEARQQGLTSHIIPNQIDFDGLGTKTRLKNEYPSIAKLSDPNNVGKLSLEEYQRAIKDLGIIEREMKKVKMRKGTLTDKQSRKYHAAISAKQYIQNNMFVDQMGNPVPQFSKRHQELQTGYEENVIPYRIPALKNYSEGSATADNAYKQLLKDPFYATKAGEHYIKARQRVGKTLKYGLGGGALSAIISGLLKHYSNR